MQIATQTFARAGAEKQPDGGALSPSHGGHGDRQGAYGDSFASAMTRPHKSHPSNDGEAHSDADRQGEAGESAGFRDAQMSSVPHSRVSQSNSLGDAMHSGVQFADQIEGSDATPLTPEAQSITDGKAQAQMVRDQTAAIAPATENNAIMPLAQAADSLGALEQSSRASMVESGFPSSEKGLTALERGQSNHLFVAGQTVDQKALANLMPPLTGNEVNAAMGRGQDPNQNSVSLIAAPDSQTLTATQTLGMTPGADLGKVAGNIVDDPAHSGGVQALNAAQTTSAEANARSAVLGLERSAMGETAGNNPANAVSSTAARTEGAGAGVPARTANPSSEALKPSIASGMPVDEAPARERPEPVDLDVPGVVKPSDRLDATGARWSISRTDNVNIIQPPGSLTSEMASLIGSDMELIVDATSDLVVGEARGAETLTARAEISGHLRTELPRHIALQLADVARTMPDRPVELTLSPEELGRLRLTFSGDLSAMTVTVNVERPETLELMRRHIDTLAREMQEIGYQEVSFSFEHSSSEHGDGGSGADATKTDNNLLGGTSSEVAELEQLAPVRLKIEPGSGLDIRL